MTITSRHIHVIINYNTLFKLRNVVNGRLVRRGMALLHGRYTDNRLGGGTNVGSLIFGPTKSGRRRLRFLTRTEYSSLHIFCYNKLCNNMYYRVCYNVYDITENVNPHFHKILIYSPHITFRYCLQFGWTALMKRFFCHVGRV